MEWDIMTTRASVEQQRAKEKERKDQAKVLASNSKVTATHTACGVTKQLIARHKAKDRTIQDGILATDAKDQVTNGSSDIGKDLERWATVAPASSSSVTRESHGRSPIKNRPDVATVPKQPNRRVTVEWRVQEQAHVRQRWSVVGDRPSGPWKVGGMGNNDVDKICDQRRWKNALWENWRPDQRQPAHQPLGERVCCLLLKTNKRDRSTLERLREGIWLGMRPRTNEALIRTLCGVVKTRTIKTLPEDEKWRGASIPKEIKSSCGWWQHPWRHCWMRVQSTETGWSRQSSWGKCKSGTSPCAHERNSASYCDRGSVGEVCTWQGSCSSTWEKTQVLACEILREKNGPNHSTEHGQWPQDQMSNTSEGKTAFMARRMMTQGSPGTNPMSETNMRDSSKKQADVDIEELEQDANDESNENVTLGDDVEMGVESQGGQALGLSIVNIAESKNSLRGWNSIMNIASVCPAVTSPSWKTETVRSPDCVLITSPLCWNSFKLASLNLRSKGVSHREQTTRSTRTPWIHLQIHHDSPQKQGISSTNSLTAHISGTINVFKRFCPVTQTMETKQSLIDVNSGRWMLTTSDWRDITEHATGLQARHPPLTRHLVANCAEKDIEHAQSSTCETRDAQACPPQLFKTIMSTIELQRKWDERGIKLLATIETEGKMPTGNANIPEGRQSNWKHGTTTVEKLDPTTVLAPNEKMDASKQWGRSRRFRYHIALPEQGESQSEHNGETSTRRSVQRHSSQLMVAKEFNNKKSDDLFAGTPLVEAMRVTISLAASGATPQNIDDLWTWVVRTCTKRKNAGMKCTLNHAQRMRSAAGKLEKAMCGMRSAAQDWQHEIKRRMLSIWCLQGKSNPCLFHNPSSEVACLVHSDDFLAAGEETALKQLKEQLAKEWKIKTHTSMKLNTSESTCESWTESFEFIHDEESPLNPTRDMPRSWSETWMEIQADSWQHWWRNKREDHRREQNERLWRIGWRSDHKVSRIRGQSKVSRCGSWWHCFSVQRVGPLHVFTIKTRLGKASEVGEIPTTQTLVCILAWISRHDKWSHFFLW